MQGSIPGIDTFVGPDVYQGSFLGRIRVATSRLQLHRFILGRGITFLALLNLLSSASSLGHVSDSGYISPEVLRTTSMLSIVSIEGETKLPMKESPHGRLSELIDTLICVDH